MAHGYKYYGHCYECSKYYKEHEQICAECGSEATFLDLATNLRECSDHTLIVILNLLPSSSVVGN